MLKAPAEDKAHASARWSSTPAGRGSSGTDYVENPQNLFGAAVLKHYDIVGFDPRGVGASTPLTCLSDTQLDRTLASDPDPDTPAEVRHSDALLQALRRGCMRGAATWPGTCPRSRSPRTWTCCVLRSGSTS